MKNFAWDSPYALLALCAVPALALVLLYAARMRRRALSRFASGTAVAALTAELDARRRQIRAVLSIAAFALAALGAAGPSWKARAPVAARGHDVVLLFDVSKSMLARDAHPSRLEAARRLARELPGSVARGRLGVAAFAGSTEVLCPLTSDLEFARGAIDGLSTASAARGGTDLAGAVESALETGFDDLPVKSRVLVVFTDGETHGAAPGPELARRAARQGVRIAFVAFGDETGARIPLPDGRFMLNGGREVWTKPDRAALAGVGNAPVIDGRSEGALARLRAVAGAEEGAAFAYEREQGYQVPLVAGFAVLLVLLLLPERRKVSP